MTDQERVAMIRRTLDICNKEMAEQGLLGVVDGNDDVYSLDLRWALDQLEAAWARAEAAELRVAQLREALETIDRCSVDAPSAAEARAALETP